MNDNNAYIYISVIICTYNRDKYIYNVLKSIAENTLSRDKYEIVLVNNNSTDSTETECNRFCTDYSNVKFRYLIETNQGLSYARNRGIQEAEGNVVVYVDDDATINKEYLQTYYDFFVKDDKVIVNEINTVPGSLAYYLFCENTAKFKDMLNEMIAYAETVFNRSQMIKKSYDTKILSTLRPKGSKTI